MAVPGERTRIPQKREGIKGGYLTSKSLRLFNFAIIEQGGRETGKILREAARTQLMY